MCHYDYGDPCILRPLVQPEKYCLKLEVVLKWRDIYVENIRVVSLMAGLKMEGITLNRGVLNRRTAVLEKCNQVQSIAVAITIFSSFAVGSCHVPEMPCIRVFNQC